MRCSDHLGGPEFTLDCGRVRSRSRERDLENLKRLDLYCAHAAAPSGPGAALLGSRRKTGQLRAKFPQLCEIGRFLAAGKDPHPLDFPIEEKDKDADKDDSAPPALTPGDAAAA
jgi:hypothetical protein